MWTYSVPILVSYNKPSPNLLCSDSMHQEFGKSPEGRLVYIPQCVVSAGKTIWRCIYSQVWLILVVAWDTIWLSTRVPISSLPSLVWTSLQHGGLRVVTFLTMTRATGSSVLANKIENASCFMAQPWQSPSMTFLKH